MCVILLALESYAGFWKNFPSKLQNQSAETLICIVTSMYSLELLH